MALRQPAASRAGSLDATQAIVQHLLRILTQLCSSLAANSGPAGNSNSRQALGKLLAEYNQFLGQLHKKADSLRSIRIPLDAIRHLDTSGMGLEAWSQGLEERLQRAHDEVQGRTVPLGEAVVRLGQSGWTPSDGAAAQLEPAEGCIQRGRSSTPAAPSLEHAAAQGRGGAPVVEPLPAKVVQDPGQPSPHDPGLTSRPTEESQQKQRELLPPPPALAVPQERRGMPPPLAPAVNPGPAAASNPAAARSQPVNLGLTAAETPPQGHPQSRAGTIAPSSPSRQEAPPQKRKSLTLRSAACPHSCPEQPREREPAAQEEQTGPAAPSSPSRTVKQPSLGSSHGPVSLQAAEARPEQQGTTAPAGFRIRAPEHSSLEPEPVQPDPPVPGHRPGGRKLHITRSAVAPSIEGIKEGVQPVANVDILRGPAAEQPPPEPQVPPAPVQAAPMEAEDAISTSSDVSPRDPGTVGHSRPHREPDTVTVGPKPVEEQAAAKPGSMPPDVKMAEALPVEAKVTDVAISEMAGSTQGGQFAAPGKLLQSVEATQSGVQIRIQLDLRQCQSAPVASANNAAVSRREARRPTKAEALPVSQTATQSCRQVQARAPKRRLELVQSTHVDSSQQVAAPVPTRMVTRSTSNGSTRQTRYSTSLAEQQAQSMAAHVPQAPVAARPAAKAVPSAAAQTALSPVTRGRRSSRGRGRGQPGSPPMDGRECSPPPSSQRPTGLPQRPVGQPQQARRLPGDVMDNAEVQKKRLRILKC